MAVYLLSKTNITEYEKYNSFSFKTRFIPKIITIFRNKKGENKVKVLVIPDVHLKDWMFERAAELMRRGVAEQAVCLMDIPDDWNKQFQIGLYEKVFDVAIQFAKDFPNTLWCYGNHDLSYLWGQLETGYSVYAENTVLSKLSELRRAILSEDLIKYIHKIDNVLFSHAGLSHRYVQCFVSKDKRRDIDVVLKEVNSFGCDMMWNDASPIWLRQLQARERMLKAREYIQVVGHTPVEKIIKDKNVIFCDTFSTYRDGTPIGMEEFLLIDTVTGEYSGIK